MLSLKFNIIGVKLPQKNHFYARFGNTFIKINKYECAYDFYSFILISIKQRKNVLELFSYNFKILLCSIT